jgi:hypothetical protein
MRRSVQEAIRAARASWKDFERYGVTHRPGAAWELIVTVWVLQAGSGEVAKTEALAGYRCQAECVAAIERVVAGRMSMPGVVSASARCAVER